MKTILIPTDFTADSLSLLKIALNTEKEKKVNIVLGYGKNLSWSITDLLYYSKKSLIKELEDDEFKEAKEIILNKYGSMINSIRVEVFHGYNQSSFENFLKGNNIDCSVLPESDIVLNYKLKKGFNIIPFIKNSDLPLKTVGYKNDYITATQGSLFKLITS